MSPSTYWPSSRWSCPTWNQEMCAAWGPPPVTKCHATPRDITKPAPIAAIPYTGPLPGVRLPKNSVRAADANGRAAMIHAYLITGGSPFEEVHLVDVDGLAVSVNEDDDREPDADLGRGHGDHEQGEHLA